MQHALQVLASVSHGRRGAWRSVEQVMQVVASELSSGQVSRFLLASHLCADCTLSCASHGKQVISAMPECRVTWQNMAAVPLALTQCLGEGGECEVMLPKCCLVAASAQEMAKHLSQEADIAAAALNARSRVQKVC